MLITILRLLVVYYDYDVLAKHLHSLTCQYVIYFLCCRAVYSHVIELLMSYSACVQVTTITMAM